MGLNEYGLIQQQQPFILTRLFFPGVYWGQPRLWPSHNILLHLDLSQASSLQIPFFLISSLNTSLHLFLGLPFTPSSSSTCSVSILFIQHNSSLLSTWPNHLSLFHSHALYSIGEEKIKVHRLGAICCCFSD